MPYDDELIESLLEDDEAFIQDEGWDREAAEALPRYRRAYPQSGRTFVGLPRPARPVPGIRGGVVRTPGGGRAQVTLPTAAATKDAVDAIVKELKADIAKNAAAIQKVDKTLDTNTSMLDKKITAVQSDLKKVQQQSQFSTMLPLLISQPPKLASITAQGASPTVITDTKYQSGDSTGLLLAMMAMTGGLGGGAGGGDTSTALILALALGGFGK
jgi:hypothetical protein